MPNSLDSSTTSASAEIVQARIDEKRLFEARFLFHKFSQAIEPQVRLRLEQVLEDNIARAGQHFIRGRRMEEQQRYEEAERDYGRVLAIAVDYPAIEQALQRIVVVRKLGPLQVPSSPDDGGEPPEQAVSVDEVLGSDGTGGSGLRRRWKVLAFSLLVVFMSFAGMLLTGRGFLGSDHSEMASEKSLPPGSTLVVPQATDPPAMFQETFSREKNRKEKMTGIVLPRVIAPPIIKDVTVPPVKAGSVVKNTHDKKVPVQQPVVEEQPVIRVIIPLQGQVVKVPANNDTLLALEESSEIVQKAAAKEKQETGAAATGKVDQSSTGTIKARIYTVQAGDTLEAIAGKVYGDRSQWSSLARANREHLGRPPYVLAVGEKIVIPPREEAAKIHSVSPDATDGTYTVVSGDSLGVIARKVYGSSRRWQRLYDLNRDRLASPSALRVGQKLRTRKDMDASVDSDPVGE